jgi:flagellar biosynthesis protein FlhB
MNLRPGRHMLISSLLLAPLLVLLTLLPVLLALLLVLLVPLVLLVALLFVLGIVPPAFRRLQDFSHWRR